jgi:hypothetical protein
MKKVVLSLLLLAPVLCWAQQSSSGDASPAGTVATSVNFPIERVVTPNAADLYCAGFIGKDVSAREKFVPATLSICTARDTTPARSTLSSAS